MAFGTGHHGTTKGCLLALDSLISKNKRLDNVIDIGCGTAVLAMAVGKVSSSKIIASDVDQVAVEVALANLKANKLQNRIDCLEAMGFENELIKSNAPFDLIFANILKPPLIDLAPSIRNYLKSGGHAIVSGILDVQASEIIEVYHQNNLKVLDRIDIGEWVTLTLQIFERVICFGNNLKIASFQNQAVKTRLTTYWIIKALDFVHVSCYSFF
jgi:ribosomal protein L11 methyltransferase